MIPRLYKAAMEGQVEILNQYINQFDVGLTENNNTILHVAAQFGQLSCVESILQECQPSLLHMRNCKHETPLHIAARAGKLGIVEALIKQAKEVESEGQTTQELLRAMNSDEDTALHIAVQNVHLEIARFLTMEDREFSYPANKAEETLLYLAAERQCYDMVVVILDNCSFPRYSGPEGQTALHHAALSDKPEITKTLLLRKPELIDKPDAQGWTPLHYAARCNNVQLVEMILRTNYFLAHNRTGDQDGGRTALHVAAALGNVEVMKKILSECPECWETVDCKGRNILHIAADVERKQVLQYIFKMSWSGELIHRKDNEGNTPLHLLAESEVQDPPFMQRYNKVYYFTFNNKNMSPCEVLFSEQKRRRRYGHIVSWRNILRNDDDNLAKWKQARKNRLEETKKARQNLENERVKAVNKMAKTHVIVATLIATITFTASFTIPGGYYSDSSSDKKGTPILARKLAFKAFVIANAIGLICSVFSVFLYVTSSAYILEYRRATRHLLAFFLIIIAMAAMVVAFITGSYSMLPHALGLPIVVVGSISFLLSFKELQYSFRKVITTYIGKDKD